jgi:hypothetical protein
MEPRRRGIQQEVEMGVVTLEVSESQVVDSVRRVSPEAKRAILRALIPQLYELDDLVDYGDQRIRALCADRGLDWDSLTEGERQELIEDLLHDA